MFERIVKGIEDMFKSSHDELIADSVRAKKREEQKVIVRTATLDSLIHPKRRRPVRVGMVAAETGLLGSEDLYEILAAIESSTKNDEHDIVVTPEYSFFPIDGPLSYEDLLKYAVILSNMSKSNTLIIGNFVWTSSKLLLNTCIGFYNGDIHFSHSKQVDGGETLLARRHNLYFIAEDYDFAKPAEFTWEGYDCVLEICAEGGIAKKQGIRDKDMYFLVSAGCKFPKVECVRKGGYGIVVDGLSKTTDAVKVTKPLPIARYEHVPVI